MNRLRKILKGDIAIWVLFLVMVIISLVAVYSSVGYMALTRMHVSPTHALLKHLVIIIISCVAAIGASHINYQAYSRLSRILFIIAIALLYISFGSESFGNERWIKIPLINLQFQPSEIAKIAVILYSASILTLRHDKAQEPLTFVMLMIVMVLTVFPIFFENLSTAIIITLSCLALMFYGGVKKSYLTKTVIVGLVCVVVLIGGAYYIFNSSFADMARETPLARAETWSNRVNRWLNPNVHSITQENTAKMAIADGQLIGVGIGKTVHSRLMTEANNDFIYAIIIEEVGAVGGILVFFIYTVFYMRCIRLAVQSRRRFGGLVVGGISTTIYLQAMIHMCVSLGVIPVTGQTLPFISQGGTSYVIMASGIGIMQAVFEDLRQRNSKANATPSAAEATAEQAAEATATE